jgi:hypothetical protein
MSATGHEAWMARLAIALEDSGYVAFLTNERGNG